MLLMISDQIMDAARTVADLDDYFKELRATADWLLTGQTASERGYFSPGEDNAVRQLLVSYWQSRNALSELVVSFREDTSLPAEMRPAAFLVAFAAALLLVDAARFLREHFEDLPIVRKKLNEPEPYFGIPANVYDTVQHSLTSTRNAWHLYHAMQYFDEHEAELRQLAEAEQLQAALAVIDQKQTRVRVAAGRYILTRARVGFRGAVNGLRRDLAGRAMYGLQKLIGCIASELRMRPGHRPQLPSAVRSQLAAIAQPGDVFITRKEYAVTNYFLPGYWPHASLYLGQPQDLVRMGLDTHDNVRPRWDRLLSCSSSEPGRVLESLKDGVRIRSVDSPFSSDALIVLRPRLAADDIAVGLARGMFHEGKPYDFNFDFSRSDRLVCTEVVYRSYDGIGNMQFELTRRHGRLTLSAEDLIDMAVAGEHFSPVAVYAPRLADGVLAGSAAQRMLAERPTAGPAPTESDAT
jgi:hypothetical protein